MCVCAIYTNSHTVYAYCIAYYLVHLLKCGQFV